MIAHNHQSVNCASPENLLAILDRLKAGTIANDGFEVLSIKNMHHAAAESDSGYRDVKVLVVSRQPNLPGPANGYYIHEIQLLLAYWLEAKKHMHLLYGVIR